MPHGPDYSTRHDGKTSRPSLLPPPLCHHLQDPSGRRFVPPRATARVVLRPHARHRALFPYPLTGGPDPRRLGGSPRTSLATEPPPSGSETLLPPRKGSTPPSPPSERPSTSSRSDWDQPGPRSDSVATRTLPMKWHRYDTKTTPQYEPMGIELDESEVGLEANRRVMTSDINLAPPKHSYVFCQLISPVVGHDGGPCTCYDVGK
jgi:hypothetical protein